MTLLFVFSSDLEQEAEGNSPSPSQPNDRELIQKHRLDLENLPPFIISMHQVCI